MLCAVLRNSSKYFIGYAVIPWNAEGSTFQEKLDPESVDTGPSDSPSGSLLTVLQLRTNYQAPKACASSSIK